MLDWVQIPWVCSHATGSKCLDCFAAIPSICCTAYAGGNLALNSTLLRLFYCKRCIMSQKERGVKMMACGCYPGCIKSAFSNTKATEVTVLIQLA